MWGIQDSGWLAGIPGKDLDREICLGPGAAGHSPFEGLGSRINHSPPHIKPPHPLNIKYNHPLASYFILVIFNIGGEGLMLGGGDYSSGRYKSRPC